MRPVTVKEILTYRERLGITEIVESPDACRSVRHLLRYPGGESGHRIKPFPNSMLILPPAATEGDYENGWNRFVSQVLFPNVSCLALPAQKISPVLRQYSSQTEMPIFSSCYDDSLLHSRLTGLLRERGERQVVIHGVLVQVLNLGVLLLGESGIGKTACALALMGKGNRWVADDAVVLEGRGDAVYGRAHQRTAALIAVRGQGIFQAPDLLGTERLLPETRVDVLVRLVRRSERRAVKKGEYFQEMVGVSLRCRDLAADVDPWRTAERVKGYVRPLSVRPSDSAAGEE